MADVKRISVSLLDLPSVSLRPVEKDTEKYKELKSSIKQDGLLNSFTVRQKEDGRFEVIDGSHRAAAVVDLFNEGDPNFQEINVQVSSADDISAMVLQIVGNSQARATPNSQYAKALQKVLVARNMTVEQLARMVSWTHSHLQNVLSLNRLPDTLSSLINQGKITLSNGILLAKLPTDTLEDPSWAEKAMTMPQTEFAVEIANKQKNLNAEKRAAKKGTEPSFEPTAVIRKRPDLEARMTQATNKVNADPSDYNRGYSDALKWVFQLDEETLAAKKAQWEKEQAEEKTNREKRSGERNFKKSADALKTMLDSGLISQDEYDVKLAQLNSKKD
jgi:ParB/RepB/Spo0J family partition protein